MPATRSGSSASPANRFTPYSSLSHAVPPSLPPTYGITDLFDWANPPAHASSPPESGAQLSVSKWLDQLEQRSLLGSTRVHTPSPRLRPAAKLSGGPSVLSISSGTSSPPTSSSSSMEPRPSANVPEYPSLPLAESSMIAHTAIPPIPFSTYRLVSEDALNSSTTPKFTAAVAPLPEAFPSVVPMVIPVESTTSASHPVAAMALDGRIPPVPPPYSHPKAPQSPAYGGKTVSGSPRVQQPAQATSMGLKTPDSGSRRGDGVETPKAPQIKLKPLRKSQSPAELLELNPRRRRVVVESEPEDSGGEARRTSPKQGPSLGHHVHPHLPSDSRGGDSSCDSSNNSVTDSSSDSSSGSSSEVDTDAITATSETEDDEIEDSEEDYESEENEHSRGDVKGKGNTGVSKARRREELRFLSSKFIDDCAQESKPKGRKINSAKVTVSVVEGRWMGKDRGAVKIRKLASNGPCTWTFSGDGVGQQPLTNRNIGDIHFSPGWAGSNDYDYWICVLSPPMNTSESSQPHTLRWSEVAEGQPHPVLKGYVLKPASGDRAPCWVKAQSYRAHNHRKNHPQ